MADNLKGLISQEEINDTLNKKINDSDTNSKLAKQQIGTMTSLKTNKKDTLVNSINELFQYASNGKTLVANAITGKGIESNSNMTFQQLATNISNIKTGYTKEEIENNVGLIKLKVETMTKTRSELPNITTDSFDILSMQKKDNLICLAYRTPYGDMDHINYYFDKDLNLVKQIKDTDDNVDWGNLYAYKYWVKGKNKIKIKNNLTMDTNDSYSFYHGSTASRTYVLYVTFRQSDDIAINHDIYHDYRCGLFEYNGYGYLVLADSIVRYNLYHTI